MARIRTAILISGTGSNMEALIRAAQSPDYPAEIALVISNRPDAPGLSKAQALGVTALSIDHTSYTDRVGFEDAIHAALVKHGIQLVALAGFMRVLTAGFVGRWAGRMVNIHPSLLPRHKGLHTHRRVLEAGDAEHGATVHWVTSELDSGGIVAQKGFAVAPDDTENALRRKVQAVEHALYPDALAKACATLL